MRFVGHAKTSDPSLMPSADGLAAARAHQRTGMALAAVSTTAIRCGIYRFASHQEMNRASDEALVLSIRMNVAMGRPGED